MDFDEHDEGEGDEDMASMPVSSSYEVPLHPAQLGSAGVAKPGDSGGGGRFTIPGGSGGGGGTCGVRYRECLKNHAVGIGGHAVDGCGEFMAAGEEGSIDALRCAACGCHRNFHRKESDGAEAAAVSPGAITAYGAMPPHHQFSPYYRTPAGYLQHQQHHQMATAAAVAAAAAAGHAHRPLALPSTSHSGRDEADDMSGMLSPMVMGSMMGMSFGSAGPSGSGKKRFRTKFSQEQKDKMQAFAERLGWRIQKHDEAAVQQFCEEVGLRRHVLKVWMHNNKHTLGKKP